MDFSDTAEEAAFRAHIRGWLEANAPREADRGVTPPESSNGLKEHIAAMKSWQARKHSVGYAAINWPVEYGGLAGSAIQSVIFAQEEACFPAARDSYFALASVISLPGRGSSSQRNR